MEKLGNLSWEAVIKTQMVAGANKAALGKQAPTEYVIFLPSGSFQVWARQMSQIETGLAKWAASELRRRGLQVSGAVRVSLVEREDLAEKECRVIAHFSDQRS